MLDPDGERIILIDDEGHILTDEQALLAMVSLVAPRHREDGHGSPCRCR